MESVVNPIAYIVESTKLLFWAIVSSMISRSGVHSNKIAMNFVSLWKNKTAYHNSLKQYFEMRGLLYSKRDVCNVLCVQIVYMKMVPLSCAHASKLD